MKKRLMVLTLLALVSCGATNSPLYSQRDTVVPYRTNFFSRDGKLQGYVKPDPVIPYQSIQYDSKGRRQGTWKPDFVIPGRMIYAPFNRKD